MTPVTDYVGIPYAPRGRTRDGLDCWGLVRLFYGEQYGIDLTGVGDAYDPADGAAVARIVEGPARDEWHEVPDPVDGDVVLCRILGYPSHVGIYLDPGRMLHARERHQVVVERLDSGAWRHRVVGYFRHAARTAQLGGGIRLVGRPHPLHTTAISAVQLAGATLADMIRAECARAGVPAALVADQGHAWIDGEYIPASEWASRKPRAGQRVEYRLLAAGGGGDIWRAVLMLAVIVVTAIYAPQFGAALAAQFGGATAGWTAAVAAGMAYAGSMLVNAIAPIRPPDAAEFGVSKPKYRLQGGANVPTPYAPIPVVLGRHRYTPPAVVEPYIESESAENYLRIAVCWGYGPLTVTDVRIGDTPIGNFEEVQQAHVVGWDGEDTSAFDALCGRDVTQEAVNTKLTKHTDVDRTIASTVNQIKLNFHFPVGLYKTPTEGENAGKMDPVQVTISVKIKETTSGSWGEVSETVYGKTLSLPWCGQLLDPALLTNGIGEEADWWLSEYGGEKLYVYGAVYIPLWCWTSITVDQAGNLIQRQGCPTDSMWEDASDHLVALLKEQNGDSPTGYDAFPLIPAGEKLVAWVCVYGGGIATVWDDYTDEAITGCAVTATGTNTEITIASGTVTRAIVETVVIERETRDAFDYPLTFDVPAGSYDVRVNLRTGDEAFIKGYYPSGNDAAFYRDCYWTTLTGFTNQAPIVAPAPLCMTAYRIKASNQLNSQIDGITGTVLAWCLDYDKTNDQWVMRHARNPASLFRWVLEGPMNPRPVDFASEMDGEQIERWHTFCRAQGFKFDAVLTTRRPLLDVLRDICAAGRASPTRVNGKWSVVIDELKPTIVQHFTPHNSWDFEGTRALPKIPHALRVRFFNERRSWQYDERVVYDDGYDVNSATLIEQIELPGITDPDTAWRFGRFHIAQMRLRPDTYTLHADVEHLICTRGDRVRVTHDVPMWGLGSGRITAIATSGSYATAITVSEPMPMKASGQSYQVRIRRETGATLVLAVTNPVADGEYTTLTFADPPLASYIADGDLVLFGLTDEESVDLIVQSIEPAANHTARITLVDYAPAIQSADEMTIPEWDSSITLPPVLKRRTIGTDKTPSILLITTDDTAMRETADGWQTGFLCAFTSPPGLPRTVTHVEAQWAYVQARMSWLPLPPVPISSGIGSVWGAAREGKIVQVRLRYVDRDGYVGPWATSTHTTIIGKTRPPGTPTGLAVTYDDNLGLTLQWNDNAELDLRDYIIRRKQGICTAADWSTATAVKVVTQSEYRLGFTVPGPAYTYMVKARDIARLESTTAAVLVVDIDAPVIPAAPTATVAANVVTLQWSVTRKSYPVVGYEVRKGSSWAGGTSLGIVNVTHFTRAEVAAGTYTYRVKAIDAAGNYSGEKVVTVAVGEPVGYVRSQSWAGTLA